MKNKQESSEMKLSDFDHFRTNPMVKFKEEVVDGKTFVIIAYVIADSKFWKEPLALETRGITFDKETGEVVSLPFHKFFNVGETEATLPNNLNWKSSYTITEKTDGSLITPVVVNDAVYLKTKKSFYSDVAEEANCSCPYPVYELSYHLLKLSKCTPIFEFTSPNNRIVLDYGSEPQFTLLAIRNNITGEYLSRKELEEIADKYQVKLVKQYPSYSYQEIVEIMKSARNREGFVIQFLENNTFVKCKTSWYLQLHRINTEIRERDIAEMVICETIDDLKAECSIAGKDLEPLEAIQDQVISELNEINTTLNVICDSLKYLSFKDIAIEFKNHPLFVLIMSVVRGKEPNIKEFWIKNYLKNYSLRCVYNKNF